MMGRVVAFPARDGGYDSVILARVSPLRLLLSPFVFLAAGFCFGIAVGMMIA